NGQVIAWDAHTGVSSRNLVAPPEGPDSWTWLRQETRNNRNISFSPDGRLLHGNGILDVTTSETILETCGTRGQCRSMIFAPDSRSLIALDCWQDEASQVAGWDVMTGRYFQSNRMYRTRLGVGAVSGDGACVAVAISE